MSWLFLVLLKIFNSSVMWLVGDGAFYWLHIEFTISGYDRDNWIFKEFT